MAQGIDSTVVISEYPSNQDYLLTALGDPTLLGNQPGGLVDDTWITVLQKLNLVNNDMTWEFVGQAGSYDIRAKSKFYGAGSSIIFTDTSDSF